MLKGKVVVVTGGAGLIGSEFIEAILKNKGIPVIADVNSVPGEQLRNRLLYKFPGHEIVFSHLNITSKESILSLIDELHQKFGRIDALVNNAYPRNKNFGRKFFDVEYDDFCENISSNIGGYFLTSQLFAKYFMHQKSGNIVNISSIYGVVAPKFDIYEGTSMSMPVEYAAIKSAIIHLTKYMATYLKGSNIRVNSLSPGGILDQQDKRFVKQYNKKCLNKGMLDVSDLKGTLIYLLSDLSVCVNGQNIVIDDGFTL